MATSRQAESGGIIPRNGRPPRGPGRLGVPGDGPGPDATGPGTGGRVGLSWRASRADGIVREPRAARRWRETGMESTERRDLLKLGGLGLAAGVASAGAALS